MTDRCNSLLTTADGTYACQLDAGHRAAFHGSMGVNWRECANTGGGTFIEATRTNDGRTRPLYGAIAIGRGHQDEPFMPAASDEPENAAALAAALVKRLNEEAVGCLARGDAHGAQVMWGVAARILSEEREAGR